MKAQVIGVRVAGSRIDAARGRRYTQYRLLIPEAENLTIWKNGDQIHFALGVPADQTVGPGVVDEVEIPDWLVLQIQVFVYTRQGLELLAGKYLPNERTGKVSL